MYKFNSEDLFIGYLKQLLSSFNLPKYRVYTKADADYNKLAIEHNKKVDSGEISGLKWPEEAPDVLESGKAKTNNSYNKFIYYINYIKNDRIQRYIDKKWVYTNWHYHYNKKELNQTKNLVVKNNTYDSYTHEYLGEYLRFQRDYNNLDLMPLYNCFSNVICQPWASPIKITQTSGTTEKVIATFDPSDARYKIYMLPVKLFKKYTIAIDSTEPVEICCSFFNKYRYKENNAIIAFQNLTYKKYNSMQFSNKVVYDALYIPNSLEQSKFNITEWPLQSTEMGELAQLEHDLKMFIKVPTTNNSSIVVLEGDYSKYGSYVVNYQRSKLDPFYRDITKASAWTKHENKFITNYETETIGEVEPWSTNYKVYKLPKVEDRDFEPITSLQLLELNSGVQHPFADRLIEYLLDNVISHTDEISDNVKRAQSILVLNNINTKEDGNWYLNYRNIFYDYMHADIPKENIIETAKLDSLGYIDKDVEKYYSAWNTLLVLDKNGKPIQIGEETVIKLLRVDPISDNRVLAANENTLLSVNSEPGEETNIKIYKTKNVSIGSIQNADIYPDIYLDSKKDITK